MQFEKPNEEEEAWREEVRELGSIISFGKTDIEIHHCVGRTAKKKTAEGTLRLGHWFILPLTSSEHRLIDQGKYGLQELKRLYSFCRGVQQDFKTMRLHDFERYLFYQVQHKARTKLDDAITEEIRQWKRKR